MSDEGFAQMSDQLNQPSQQHQYRWTFLCCGKPMPLNSTPYSNAALCDECRQRSEHAVMYAAFKARCAAPWWKRALMR